MFLSPMLVMAAALLVNQAAPQPGAVAGPMVGPPAPAADIDLAALDTCEDSLDDSIFVSPRFPHPRAPMRWMVTAQRRYQQPYLLVRDPKGVVSKLAMKPFGGPPWGWNAQIEKPRPGKWRAAVIEGDGTLISCQQTRVRRSAVGWGRKVTPEEDPVWRAGVRWERDTENLYSLWIEHLFDAPVEAELSWKRLDRVLHDKERNLLYDHLNLREDSGGRSALYLKPDCADFPYILRAYFSWKMRLPFAFRPCNRGYRGGAPTCGDIRSNYTPAEDEGAVAAFERFARRGVCGTVHSASGRTAPTDEKTDFYPVALTRESLRPGTAYFDPTGHAMVIVKWYPPEGDKAGVLMAADAQPDGTVGRRIFWRGSFLFPTDGAAAGAGFKRFRPAVRRGENVRQRGNREILRNKDYGDYSTEQFEVGKDGFYEAMDLLITPTALSPEYVIRASMDALEQQVRRRVASVDNGEAYKKRNPGKPIAMPKGASIFLTAGPWEDYSTPSRDMRLLIALDAVLSVPERVAKAPERFKLAPGEDAASAKARMAELLKTEAASRTFTYTRSDGSSWTLTLADIVARAERFEYSWNPNDCVELRWAADPNSEEATTCKTAAPAEQREVMATMRDWFVTRERPGK